MQKTDSWNEQISYYRVWRNERITESELIDMAAEHCLEHLQDVEHVLLIVATIKLNIKRYQGRIMDRAGLGLTDNNKNLGFFCHLTIAINALNGTLTCAPDIL